MSFAVGEKLDECKGIFGYLDRDYDKKLSGKDLVIAVRAVGLFPTEEDANNIASMPAVDFDQFLKVCEDISAKGVGSIDEVIDAFAVFDKGGDGFITIQEMKYIISSTRGKGEKKLSEDELDEMVNSADIDGTGKIDYAMFVTHILS